MNKNLKMALFAVGAAVIVYVAYRWWQAKQSGNTPSPQYGTNLNSVAPELIGGSTGPSVGPALSTPINITLNEAASSTAPAELPDREMQGVNTAATNSAMFRQSAAATPGIMSTATPEGMDTTSDTSMNPADVVDGGPNSDQTDASGLGVSQ